MPHDSKPMHPNFINYMEEIVSNPIYKGLPYNRKKDGSISWVAPKTGVTGKGRLKWVADKAAELGIPTDGPYYSKVMLEVHPTKTKPCHVCGKALSLFYVYPTKKFAEKINEKFNGDYTYIDSLHDIVDTLIEYQTEVTEIAKFLIHEFKLTVSDSTPIHEIVDLCENECRINGQGKLSPGAMSNYPDRLDGFHSYNRCCRETEDKGRHRDNMNTYNKDRRAYELWSDGNIKAANAFMHSTYFKGWSADHIGPVSLGFKHESFLLVRMSNGDNSAKNNRIPLSDITRLIMIEKERVEYSAISRQSTLIWDYVKREYSTENLENCRQLLLQSTNNYLNILWHIAQLPDGKGVTFLIDNILKPKFADFAFDYTFDDDGEQCSKTARHITDATRKEWDRIIRVSFESLEDYHAKDNRHIKTAIDGKTDDLMKKLSKDILNSAPTAYQTFEEILVAQQKHLLGAVR
ncbi:hypothetical protein FACS1894211_06620 [Clostridia bacterium]|nr:hypothetical protein FACS1894211_06620 [Clostridia bacterium]